MMDYLNRDVFNIIEEYCSEYVLLDGIDMDELNWDALSCNNNAVDFLLKNQDKIVWNDFLLNANDKAVDLILKNTDKINWDYFSQNVNNKAVDYLLKNTDKIHWYHFSKNPSIFKLQKPMYHP